MAKRRRKHRPHKDNRAKRLEHERIDAMMRVGMRYLARGGYLDDLLRRRP